MFVKTRAPTTEARASVEPTERSMPAGQDDQQLAHGQHGDGGGRGQDVAEVPRGEEERRQEREDHHQGEEDEERPDAQQPEPELEPPITLGDTAARGRGLLGTVLLGTVQGRRRQRRLSRHAGRLLHVVPPGRRQIVGCLSRNSGSGRFRRHHIASIHRMSSGILSRASRGIFRRTSIDPTHEDTTWAPR